MHPYLSVTPEPIPLPSPETLRPQIDEAIAWVKEHVGEDKEISSVQTFSMTAPGSMPSFDRKNYPQREYFATLEAADHC